MRDDIVHRLAGRQHGVAGRWQLRAAGIDRHAERRLTRRGVLDVLTPRVVRAVATPVTDLQPLMTAVLDFGTGSCIGDHTAAGLWRLPGFGIGDVPVVIRQRDATGQAPRRHLGRLASVRWIAPDHVTEVLGIPVLTLPVTLYRLAGQLGWERFERVADAVCGRAPRVLEALHALLPEMAAPGRNGISAIRRFLAERPPGYCGPHTSLEARVNQILRGAGERPLECQVDLGGHSWIGRVDFVDRQVPFVLEVNSDTFHGMPTHRADDAERYARLAAAGHGKVIVATEQMVWQRPMDLLALIRGVRRGPER